MATIVWAGRFLSAAEADLLPDYALVIDGNKIIDSGTKEKMIASYPEAETIGGKQYLLMPTFVDSHDHGRALGTVPLGVPDDLLEIWLPGLWAQPVIDCYTAAAYDGIRLLQSGVTAVAHHHNVRNWGNMVKEAEDTIRGYRDVGIRVAYSPPFIDQNQLVYEDAPAFIASLPEELRELACPFAVTDILDQQTYIDKWIRLYQDFHDNQEHLIKINSNPVGGQWVSDEMLLKLVELAVEHKTQMQMHLLETSHQQLYAQRKWGKSFIQHLDEIGVLGPWLTVAHMVHVDLDDLPVVAARSVGIASNPSSNLRLRSGIAPLARMQDAGVKIGLGLDGGALDDDQDYLREMRLAWMLANKPGAQSMQISSRDVFQMGIENGIEITLGRGIPLGKLEPGYLADLVLVDFEALEGVWFKPEADPVDVLLHKGTRDHVRHVMVNGDWVVQDGKAIQVDENDIVQSIREQLDSQSGDEAANRSAQAARALAPYIRQYYAQWERND
jgi:5-methylthioadenosine/S-adenosylhomocysteine deaminase